MKILGLTDSEVHEAREKFGSNRLSEAESESFFDKLRENLSDPMIKILSAALLINVIIYFLGLTGIVNTETEWYEPVGIAAAIAIAALVSTFSEYRNENAFRALQEEASKILCKAYRNGEIREIPIDDIVSGDYIMLGAGDRIPADGVIYEGSIKTDQSVLNGESKEASKRPKKGNEPPSDKNDLLSEYRVFRGTVVCSGNAVMIAETVGDKTLYGEIAGELRQDDDRDSPLKLKLTRLAESISKFGYIGGVAIAAALLIHKIVMAGSFGAYFAGGAAAIITDLLDALILAVIIIVMAVPEGLPLMIAIVSAMNMRKMLADNVLVRKISGIETAGSLNILFSDKTGTITKGMLEAVIFADGNGNEYRSMEDIPHGLSRLLSLCIYENSTAVMSGGRAVGGNATERAVLSFLGEHIPKIDVKKLYTLPFNSDNKYSASSVEVSASEDMAFRGTLVKGAPEKLLPLCKYSYDRDGKRVPFQSAVIDELINSLAERAIRVIALAVCDSVLTEESEGLPAGEYVLCGILGIRDEVRPESAAAISEVINAGVQVVMITGDRIDTASAIAKESGLLTGCEKELTLTSAELAKLSDKELSGKLKDIRVIARALPSDKSRLVRIAAELDLVAGMTGDGVNDSPALKKADVGFAMGSGTEVAKEASDIVILDDNFSSIGKAVLYGRTIFNSIRKFIIFQLTINVSAVVISFIAPLLGMDNPLSITQILWVNLVMDTLAALAFGSEPALSRYMREKPKSRREPIVNTYMKTEIITGAAWVVILSLVFLLTGLDTASGTIKEHGFIGRYFRDTMYLFTGYFSFFIFAAVANAFNARTEELNLFDNIGKNRGFLKVMGIIAAVQVIMTYLGGSVLGCYGLDLREWAVILVMALSVIPVDIIRKLIIKQNNRRRSL
ncbi:MAG: calcium-translocating P-type ATPase, PMCA-type [Oscillospiraceae bacterium]|nr:calcium-translocating P-type ATPase, PMCA-type [Oscillospiraceae bacterium]